MILCLCRHIAVRLAGLLLVCVFALGGCGGVGGGRGQELPSPREHSAFKTMILAQPQFGEDELLRFVADAAPTVGMPGEEGLDYLAAVKGWRKERASYMILKLGMASESILAKQSYAALFSIIPRELYPSPAETDLVRKHQAAVVPLFIPDQHNPAPGQVLRQAPHD